MSTNIFMENYEAMGTQERSVCKRVKTREEEKVGICLYTAMVYLTLLRRMNASA